MRERPCWFFISIATPTSLVVTLCGMLYSRKCNYSDIWHLRLGSANTHLTFLWCNTEDDSIYFTLARVIKNLHNERMAHDWRVQLKILAIA